MKIKFKATSKAPEYDISGKVITATNNDEIEIIDLSEFPKGAKWQGGELEKISDLNSLDVIFNVFHDGELHVTLCQKIPDPQTGNWVESDWIDSNDYDPNELYIKEVSDEG